MPCRKLLITRKRADSTDNIQKFIYYTFRYLLHLHNENKLIENEIFCGQIAIENGKEMAAVTLAATKCALTYSNYVI